MSSRARPGTTEAPGVAPAADSTAFAGARALAAWWIVFSHSADWLLAVLPELGFLTPLAHTGLAVDFFFILSGYSIARAYLDRTWTLRSYGRYLRNRLARLYPAHLAVLVAFLALLIGGTAVGIASEEGAFPPMGFLAELTLTRVWFGDALWWNPPAWSLSAQLLAFMVFPAIAVVLRRRLRSTPVVAALAVGLIAISTLSAAVAPSAMNGMAAPGIRVLCGFILGVCIFLATRTVPVTRRAAWVAGGGAAGLIAWAALTFGAIIVGGLAVASPRSTGWLRSRTARVLGRLSFSTYLVHVFVLILLAKLITPASVADLPLALRAPILIVWTGAILGASWLLHALVEAPAHRRLASRRAASVQTRGPRVGLCASSDDRLSRGTEPASDALRHAQRRTHEPEHDDDQRDPEHQPGRSDWRIQERRRGDLADTTRHGDRDREHEREPRRAEQEQQQADSQDDADGRSGDRPARIPSAEPEQQHAEHEETDRDPG
ncbi:hypothetical protein ABMA10_21065 [Plantibacter sp. RU18]